MTTIAMIPARLGSQRLRQKNLLPLQGKPLLAHAVRKALDCGLFDEVWVNTENDTLGEIGLAEGARFHRRPAELADNVATSEEFVAEFLRAHPCTYLVQLHSIAPLLTQVELAHFVRVLQQGAHDALLSVVDEPLEAFCAGRPVNFSLSSKTNSQDLQPVRRVSWAVTGWRSATYLDAVEQGQCATYAGRVGCVPLSRMAGMVIKTAEDLAIAEALYPLAHRHAAPAQPQPGIAAGVPAGIAAGIAA